MAMLNMGIRSKFVLSQVHNDISDFRVLSRVEARLRLGPWDISQPEVSGDLERWRDMPVTHSLSTAHIAREGDPVKVFIWPKHDIPPR